MRERIDTPDNDFLDLDWSRVGSDNLLIISHGLEGSSERHYARGLAKLFNQNGYDVSAWNNRSCSGEMNIQPVLYHHGSSYDLKTVIDHVYLEMPDRGGHTGFMVKGQEFTWTEYRFLEFLTS